MDLYEIFVDESPSRPKWDEKIIQVAGELVGNPQEPRKNRSQATNASFANDSSLTEHYYILIGSYKNKYKQYFNEPIWKTTMEEEFHSLQENETWELVPLLPRGSLFNASGYFKLKLILMVQM